MDYGLGLILSFTDNATAGINNAVNTLNRLTQTAENASNSLNEMASLSALSVVSGQIGNAFTSVGSTILSTFSSIISKVNETGTTLMYAEKQLDALYASSGKTGAEIIGQIQKYAKESMFDFENLIPAVTSLKSVGIEAFDAITSSTGEARYSLLDYASGLASFAPQMRNAYGTGINAAIGAMREYIAEGNALSLKRGAGLDITGILGEDKGATIEERTRQVADLIEKLGMLDMVSSMKDSPTVKLSNMGDILFQLKGMISDSDIGGVSTAVNRIIDVFYNFVTGIEESRLETIARNIGSALTTMIKPVEWIAKAVVKLAEGFVRLIETSPMLTKLVTVGAVVGGALLLLMGIVLKFTSALSGISLLLLTMGKSFGSIGTLMKTGSLKILGALLPLTATLGLMYLAWKSDFGGMRTLLTNFVTNLANSFKLARATVSGSVENLISTMNMLERKDDFFSNLTLGIMRVMMFMQALSDAWGDYTLSEENFLKAKELGILPLIEAVLDLKYRFGLFKDGFIAGWKEISNKVVQAVTGFTDKIEGTSLESLFDSVASLLKKLSSGDAEAWYKFGEGFAKFTAFLISFVAIAKTIGTVVGIATKLAGVFTKVWGVLTKLWGVITTVGSAISTVVGVVGSLVTALLGFFGIVVTAPAWVVGAITLAIATIIGLVIHFREEILTFFVDVWEKIKEIFSMVGTWFGGVFNSAVEAIKTFFAPITDFFRGVWESIRQIFTNIGETVSNAITGVVTNAINSVLSRAVSLINGFISGINTALGIINAIPGVNIPLVPKLPVPQMALGGVVDKPTMSIIGEAGAEAVVPLENNLGWISRLANEITSEMRPSNSHGVISSDSGTSQEYITKTNTSHTYQGDTDNSIVFNEGAIQITVQNASEEEAIRLAKKILEYIKRQRQLDKMLSYA